MKSTRSSAIVSSLYWAQVTAPAVAATAVPVRTGGGPRTYRRPRWRVGEVDVVEANRPGPRSGCRGHTVELRRACRVAGSHRGLARGDRVRPRGRSVLAG